jgi:hypothetical protein
MIVVPFNLYFFILPLSVVERHTRKDPPQTPRLKGICGSFLLFVSMYHYLISLF